MSELLLDEDQRTLRATITDFLREVAPPAAVRHRMEEPEGFDRGVYDRLAREIGLPGLLVPEELGGSGAGVTEAAVAAEALGSGLLPGPHLATTWATLLLRELPQSAAVHELLTEVASGRLLLTVVESTTRPTATRSGEGVLLRGRAGPVLSGAEADRLLVVAGLDGEAVVADVDAAAPGLVRTPLEVLDLTRRQAHVELSSVPARLLSGTSVPERASDAADRARDAAAVVLGGEQLGVMRAALDAIVAYGGLRMAFGRPIGSYQGVKHQLADLHASVELVESVVRHAAWTADHDPQGLPLAAVLTSCFAGREAFAVTAEALRLFGGIGYTWEHDAHLYFKRAKSAQLLFGRPHQARARIADLIGLSTEGDRS